MDYNGEGKIYDWGMYAAYVLVLAEIDNNGNVKKEAITSTSNTTVILDPQKSNLISDNELIMYGRLRYTYRFAKISIF